MSKIVTSFGGSFGSNTNSLLNRDLYDTETFLEFNASDVSAGMLIESLMNSPQSFRNGLALFKEKVMNPRGIEWKLSTKPNAVFGFVDWEKMIPVPHSMECMRNWENEYGVERGRYVYSQALKSAVEYVEWRIQSLRPTFTMYLYGACQLHHYTFNHKVSSHALLFDNFNKLFFGYFSWMEKYAIQHFIPVNNTFTSQEINDWISAYFYNISIQKNTPKVYFLAPKYSNDSGFLAKEFLNSNIGVLRENISPEDIIVLWGNIKNATESTNCVNLLNSLNVNI